MSDSELSCMCRERHGESICSTCLDNVIDRRFASERREHNHTYG